MTTALAALGGASRQSLAAARSALDSVLKASSAADASALATELLIPLLHFVAPSQMVRAMQLPSQNWQLISLENRFRLLHSSSSLISLRFVGRALRISVMSSSNWR
jgi:hypothetical protein